RSSARLRSWRLFARTLAQAAPNESHRTSLGGAASSPLPMGLQCIVRRRLATAARARLLFRPATEGSASGGVSVRGQRGLYRLQPVERAGRRLLAAKVSGIGEVERLFRAGQIGTARRHDDALGRR